MENESYTLSGRLPDGTELRIALAGERLTIGRPVPGRPNCDIALAHETVSHDHALLERKTGGWVLSDAGSRNGTKVNGIAVARRMLADGDEVSFGHVRLTYRSATAGGAQLTRALEMETRVLSESGTCALSCSPSVPSLVGRSAALQDAVRLAVKAARARTEPLVMINGESGTGKELFARLVYDESRRRDKRFVVVNCGAFDSSLVSDMLFGHVKGAFTNADKDRAGVFEEADGGTVFLDEIGEISSEIQAKLLRVIQEKTLTRLGSNVEKKVDVRIVCATNRDLRKMVAEGKFREDLFYRLNVITIRLPPLRERVGDVEDLIRHFTDLFGGGLITVSGDAMKALCRYDWPGNVRELRNVMERTVTLAEGEEIRMSDLPPEIVAAKAEESEAETAGCPPVGAASCGATPGGSGESGPSGTLEAREIAYIQQVLDRCGGNVSDAARILGIGRSTLNAKISRHGLKVTRLPAVSRPALVLLAAILTVTAGSVSGAAPLPADVPELMRCEDGTAVTTVRQWEERRRAEILDFFTREVYGRRPVDRPENLRFEAAEPDAVLMKGAAIRKRIRASWKGPLGTHAFVFTAFIPKKAAEAGRKSPAFLLICNRPPAENIDPTRRHTSYFWPAEEIVDRGYAALAFYNGDLAPDDRSPVFTNGVYTAYGPRGRDTWGALSAWAWGASRVMDWIETEPTLDAAHVAVVGHSRGGKTALVAGVTDRRFAMACSNDSGCGGAKLNHIDLPKSESVRVITRRFRHWFSLEYDKWAGREREMPYDQHEWMALMAPRLLAVASATEDGWAGQLGEFHAARLASPAWELYGKKGLVAPEQPPVCGDRPADGLVYQEGSVSYHIRPGHHALSAYDWHRYMDFADRHGWRNP